MAGSFRTAATCALALGLLAVTAAQQPAQPQGQPAQPPQQPAPADAQQPPPADNQQPAQPVFRTGINFVRVDVIVSDSKGGAVGDLNADDFEVVEDGKAQKIEAFKLINLDGGVKEAQKEAPMPIRSDYEEESEAARDDVRLFSIFLDDYHVRRASSVAARGQIAKFVQTQLGPSDMIGVMYPLQSVQTVRMTRNHDAIVGAVQQFTGRKFDYTPMNPYEQQYAEYPAEVVEKIRNEVSLDAIRALIIHMGSLKEGRKALILVSEGFAANLPPQLRSENAQLPGSGNPNANNPFAGAGDINEDRTNWAAGLDLTDELQQVWADANRNNVAIYAVDPRGLAGSEFEINENVGAETDNKYLNATIDTLRMLASNTDGRAIVNRNDLTTGMNQIVRDSSAYYLIGYNSSSAPSDGKFHEIKVRVKRTGLQVRSRKGYWALTADETAHALAPPKPAMAKDLSDALASVTASPRSRVVRTWIGTSKGEDGKTKVTFVWEPTPKAPGEAAHSGDAPAQVSLMAVGADGNPYYRGKFAKSTSFELPPGKSQLRISVEGAASQVLDSEIRELDVPDLTSPQTTLGTPIVLQARTLREFEQLKTDTDPLPVTARDFSRTERLLIRVPAYGPGTSAPTLSARLLNRGGAPMADVPVALQPTSTTPGQIELTLSALAPGEYLVEITASGQGGDAKQVVAIRVTA